MKPQHLLALIVITALAFVLYKWMADEPILPKIEPTNFEPEYQFDDSFNSKG